MTDESLSDLVARRVVSFRKRHDLTRDQLAARCAKLGYPALTGPALANIETGRRLPDGRRRRDVTVDEVTVLARALEVDTARLMSAIDEEPDGTTFAFLVSSPSGSVRATTDEKLAHDLARHTGSFVARVPVVADYRTEGNPR
jgi:transcriptional regulator with XRE-family HTH domain